MTLVVTRAQAPGVKRRLTLFVALLGVVACKSSEAPPAPAAPLDSGIAPAGQRAAPALGRGDRAPDFNLQGSDGKMHALADSAGKQAVVIAWFPKAFTGG